MTQANPGPDSQPATFQTSQAPHHQHHLYFQPTGQLMTYYKAADSSSLWLLPVTNVIVATPIFVSAHPTLDTQTNSGVQTRPVVCEQGGVPYELPEQNTPLPHSDCTPVQVANNQRVGQVEQTIPSLSHGQQRSMQPQQG